MPSKVVIGIVGLPGSGKSTALSVIKNLAPIVVMGDIVRSEVRKTGDEINPTTLGEMSKKLRENFGDTIIAEKCVEVVNQIDENVIFIDGIRSMYEVNFFRTFWDFHIVAITCPDKLRHKRLLNRNRADDSLDLTMLEERDNREKGYGLEQVINSSDYEIVNDKDFESLEEKILKFTCKFLTS
jgi:dephospho-CoA kinase